MPQERTLPIQAEHREFTIKVDGAELERTHQLLAVSVTKVANKIAAARLVYLDGAAAASDFPLSKSDKLIPGAEVEVVALEKLAGGFRQDEGDRPFGLAQALVVGLPVFRQPVSAALDGELAAEVGEDEEDGLQQHDERHQPGERAGRIVVLDVIRVGHRESMWAPWRG